MVFSRDCYGALPSQFAPIQWTCGANAPNWVAPQVVPFAGGGGTPVRLTSQHRRVRKHVGVDTEAAISGRCPGSYTPYPYEIIADQTVIAHATRTAPRPAAAPTIVTPPVVTATPQPTISTASAPAQPFKLFTPSY
jgi:hypothetical protein